MLVAMSSRGPDSAGVALHDGDTMEVVKDVGSPAEICARYDIVDRAGFQGTGHARMATESAVPPRHSHPFAPLRFIHADAVTTADRTIYFRNLLHCSPTNGGDCIGYFADVEHAEFDANHATVSQREIDRHLTLTWAGRTGTWRRPGHQGDNDQRKGGSPCYSLRPRLSD